jgi:hypothetical protein
MVWILILIVVYDVNIYIYINCINTQRDGFDKVTKLAYNVETINNAAQFRAVVLMERRRRKNSTWERFHSQFKWPQNAQPS